jgi:hypothetical protein
MCSAIEIPRPGTRGIDMFVHLRREEYSVILEEPFHLSPYDDMLAGVLGRCAYLCLVIIGQQQRELPEHL